MLCHYLEYFLLSASRLYIKCPIVLPKQLIHQFSDIFIQKKTKF